MTLAALIEKIDVDKLALGCGFHVGKFLGDKYMYGIGDITDNLTAYTRAVLEEAAKACDKQAAEYFNLTAFDRSAGAEKCAAAIREMMP